MKLLAMILALGLGLTSVSSVAFAQSSDTTTNSKAKHKKSKKKKKSNKGKKKSKLKKHRTTSQNDAPMSELQTDVKFDDSVLHGQYQAPEEALARVENEKGLNDLIGVRKNFKDRLEVASEQE